MEQNLENQKIIVAPENLVANAEKADQAAFYRKTYAHVALAILLFIAVESIFLKMDSFVQFMLSMLSGYKWLVILGLFWLGSTMSERLAYSTQKSTQYLGLVFYVVLEAVIFLPLIAIVVMNGNGMATLNQAAIVTLGMFAGLTAVVLLTKLNFSFLRTVLLVGTFIVLGLIVAGSLFGFDLGLWFVVGMVVFASAAILYQTYLLKTRYSTDQYVGASIGLFASVMLLFWYVINLLLSRD